MSPLQDGDEKNVSSTRNQGTASESPHSGGKPNTKTEQAVIIATEEAEQDDEVSELSEMLNLAASFSPPSSPLARLSIRAPASPQRISLRDKTEFAVLNLPSPPQIETRSRRHSCDSDSLSLSTSGRSILKNSSAYTAGKSAVSKSSIKRNSSTVSFQGGVNIREYERTIGDNPSCLSGVPISLDWSYSVENHVSLDDYEKYRGVKRYGSLLRMPKKTREELLMNNLGFSEEELSATKKEVKKIQRSRSVNEMKSMFWRVEDAGGSAIRKIKRTLGKGTKAQTKPQNEHDAAVAYEILQSKRRGSFVMDHSGHSAGLSSVTRKIDTLQRSLGSSIGSSSSTNGPIAF